MCCGGGGAIRVKKYVLLGFGRQFARFYVVPHTSDPPGHHPFTWKYEFIGFQMCNIPTHPVRNLRALSDQNNIVSDRFSVRAQTRKTRTGAGQDAFEQTSVFTECLLSVIKLSNFPRKTLKKMYWDLRKYS